MHKYEVTMRDALAAMPVFVRAQFPKDLAAALVAMGSEIDRLRAEVNDLRSKIEKE